MTFNESNLDSQFTISSVDKIGYVDTRQLIKKDIVSVRLSEEVDTSGVGLSYVFIPLRGIEDGISILDRSNLMSDNAIAKHIVGVDIQITGITYDNVLSPSFIVTDKFTVATNTDPSIPIYYYHNIPQSIYGKAIVDCELLDSEYNPVSNRLYLKDLDRSSLYTNVKNSYDEQSGDVELYYARYVFEDSSYSEALLNTKPIYKPATFADLDSEGNLKQGAHRYILSYSSAGGYSLTLPQAIDYSIQYTAVTQIRILSPNVSPLDRIWFPRVYNSAFTKIFSSDRYKYDIPEYSTQAFNPYEPYRFTPGKECTVINDNTIKVEDDNLVILVSESLHLDVVIKDKYGNPLQAMSTVAAKNGFDYSGTSGIVWDNGLLHSYDERDGFIKLNTKLKSTYIVEASYYYIDETYTLTQLNLNPISDSTITNYRVVMYLVPEGPLNENRSRSIYYMKVDTNGDIKYCSQDGTESTGNIDLVTGTDITVADASGFATGSDVEGLTSGATGTVEIVDTANNVIYVRSVTGIFSASEVIEQGAYSSSSSAVVVHNIIDTSYDDGTAGSFINKYTTAGSDLQDTHYLLLGDVIVTDPYRDDELNLVDIRLRGGGIKESEDVAKIISQQAEAKWYEDIGYWDGQPYSGSSVVLVKLPYEVLIEYGGNFTEQQIRKIVSKHIAHGTYPVVRFYGRIPEVLTVIPGDTKIDLTWSDLGASYTYNVYVSTREDTDFTKHNGAPISAMSYSVTGLTNNTTYYLYIRAEGPSEFNSSIDIEHPKSSTWSALPFVI